MKILEFALIFSLFCTSGLTKELTESDISEFPEPETNNMDVLLRDPMLSLKYQRGAYLVYDCISQHWVCTSKFEFNLCKDERAEAIADNNTKLPCAAFDYFEDEGNLKAEKVCNRYQMKLINRNEGKRFCLNIKNESIEKNY
jgi:hypothetical protein